MSDYKYPFIPREYYPAVMGACKMIRETGYFNKAVSFYADKYNVDRDELEKHIRARQSAGQKGKKSNNSGRKYKYFIVVETCWCEADGVTSYSNPAVLRGLSSESVVRRFIDSDWYFTVRNDYGGSYAPVRGHVAIAEFQTKEEAEKALPSWETILECKKGKKK